ncbi:hypothetical protein [Agrococcus sp. KRD186]|uniref:hypothetical protein n=1 Tax=Agrococcus sp. KRD186 TaxID=2729730 RepID=UPI0019D0AE91|nr:hypothetical protein [Agrococcus sp. KRD186]
MVISANGLADFLIERWTGRVPPSITSNDWPNENCFTEEAERVRLVVLRVKTAVDDLGVDEVGPRTGIPATEMQSWVDGRRWPTQLELAQLELGLGNRVWTRSPV